MKPLAHTLALLLLTLTFAACDDGAMANLDVGLEDTCTDEDCLSDLPVDVNLQDTDLSDLSEDTTEQKLALPNLDRPPTNLYESLPNVENVITLVEEPCHEYYKWTYTEDDRHSDPIWFEETERCDEQDIDEDGDGLAKSLDPNDSKATDWYVVNPDYEVTRTSTSSTVLISYRFFSFSGDTAQSAWPGVLNRVLENTPGITDKTQRSATKPSCGEFEEVGICIRHINPYGGMHKVYREDLIINNVGGP